MQFKPVTVKYTFDSEPLVKVYPAYMRVPLFEWIQTVLRDANKWKHNHDSLYGGTKMDSDFLNELNVTFREHFPRKLDDFLKYVFEDDERITNIIALCLQNFSTLSQASELERLLAMGGSGYRVTVTTTERTSYQRGVADLTDRVPEILQDVADETMETESLIKDAWMSCYSRNPDYSKTVNKCVDALEGLFKKKYFHSDPKPSLGKFINQFKSDPSILNFKGSDLIEDKIRVVEFAEKFIQIRGLHTSGDGRLPTKEEAEFVLYYTLWIFSIHQ